jgi:trk system potassium uptake protein
MKIIIAGAGEVGTYLAKMLCNGNHDITVIDTDEDKLRAIDAHFDLLTVIGSATSISVLKMADIRKADLFIALMEIEAVNITAAILSKKLGARNTIARINNQEYLTHDNKSFFYSLGIDSLIYPEILACQEIIALLKQTGTTKTYEFGGGKLSLFALKLEENAPIVNKSLADTAKFDGAFDYRAVAITRKSSTIIPRGNDIFQVDDMLYVITNQSGINNLMRYSGKQNYEINNVMILGGSRIGEKAAKALEGNTNVKLIETDREKCFQLADTLRNTLVVNGDGRNIELLIEEGIQKMDAFIAVTGNTDTNILSCLLAKRLGIKKTIAEIEDIDYIDLAGTMGIDTIINKKRIAASHIFSFTKEAKVSSLQFLSGTEAEVLEFEVSAKAKITSKEIKDLDFPTGAIIGGVIRGKSSFIATGNSKIKQHDKVVVFSLPEAIDKVVEFFK